MIKRIKRKIIFELSKLIKPCMISGYTLPDGKFLKNTRISNTTHIGNKEKLNVEDNVFIGHFNFIDASNGITIEEGCQITNYISLLTHSSHISIRLYGNEYTKHSNLKGYITGSVYIGKYSFIGPHSVIMPNTKIGKGCIISAFSYITGEFPDFSIISGNPARVVGDTRNIDKPFLEKNTDLLDFYNYWAK